MLTASPAFAQEEPWGGNVPGWKFTQTGESANLVNCRAMQGSNLISRRTNGRSYLSVPVPAGLPKGWYKEGRASIIIGGNAEPVDAEVTGRLLFHIDDSHYAPLAKAGAYQWRVSGPRGILSGSVSLSGDVAKVLAEVRKCASANTVTQPKPASKPNSGGKWSGEWRWVRPLMLTPNPGPQDTTVRDRTTASFELQPNNRVKVCISTNPCSVYSFAYSNGAYNVDVRGGAMSVVTNDQGRSLNGEFWWKKENRTRTTPDATFTLR